MICDHLRIRRRQRATRSDEEQRDTDKVRAEEAPQKSHAKSPPNRNRYQLIAEFVNPFERAHWRPAGDVGEKQEVKGCDTVATMLQVFPVLSGATATPDTSVIPCTGLGCSARVRVASHAWMPEIKVPTSRSAVMVNSYLQRVFRVYVERAPRLGATGFHEKTFCPPDKGRARDICSDTSAGII